MTLAQQVLIPADWPELLFTLSVIVVALAVILLVLTWVAPPLWRVVRESLEDDESLWRDPHQANDFHLDARRRELARLTQPAKKGWDAHHSDRVAGVPINGTKRKP